MSVVSDLFKSLKNGAFENINGIDYAVDIDKVLSVDEFRKKIVVTVNFKTDSSKKIVLPEDDSIVVEIKTKSNQTDPFVFEFNETISNYAMKIYCDESDFDNDTIKLKMRVSYCTKQNNVSETITIVTPDGNKSVSYPSNINHKVIVKANVSELFQDFDVSSSTKALW